MKQTMTWDQLTNAILAQRKIEVDAMRLRHQLEEQRRQLEDKMRVMTRKAAL